MADILNGIVVGAAGGATAGFLLGILHLCAKKYTEWREKERVYSWLENNVDKDKFRFRSTRAIASYNNLPEDRVRYLCSYHKKIRRSTGEEETWTIRKNDE